MKTQQLSVQRQLRNGRTGDERTQAVTNESMSGGMRVRKCCRCMRQVKKHTRQSLDPVNPCTRTCACRCIHTRKCIKSCMSSRWHAARHRNRNALATPSRRLEAGVPLPACCERGDGTCSCTRQRNLTSSSSTSSERPMMTVYRSSSVMLVSVRSAV